MVDRVGAFLAPPGGFGSLDELFEILTLAQLGIHRKPVGLLHVGGFFDALLRWMDHCVAEGFCDPSTANYSSGRCQYVPNSFVPVPPEHCGATMSPN
jgi:uncharacterized protein (TIGR00730 family)